METCTRCKTDQPIQASCSCYASSTAFSKLLLGVSNRVLSADLTSIQRQISPSGCGIDKLEGAFSNHPLIANVLADANLRGFKCRNIFLKDRRQYLEVSFSETRKIHLRIDRTKESLNHLVSNPNHFGSWYNYRTFLASVISEPALKDLRLTRIDLNLDYARSYVDIVSSIDINYKKAAVSYDDNSGVRTGMTIGKGTNTITIYDKARKENSAQSLTRIESRLRGKNLPTNKFFDFSDAIQTGSFFNEIKGVHVTPYECFNDNKSKLDDFIKLCMRDGFYSARKHFNQANNFQRDFNRLIKVESWLKSPSEQFKEQVKKFFEHDGITSLH